MAEYNTIDDLTVEGQRVLARVDFNVSYKDGKVADDERIKAARKTICHLADRGAKVILMSHLGRPDGKKNPEESMKIAAEHLSKLMGQEVTMAPGCIGSEVEGFIKKMQNCDILMLENLRFHAGEEANDLEFAKSLASLGDIYVNDAFGTAHREHASVYSVPILFDKSKKAAGYLMQKELSLWDKVVQSGGKGGILVVGGKKLEEKMKAIEDLASKFDYVFVAGVPYNVMQKAKGCYVGSSLVTEKGSSTDFVKMAKEILGKHLNIVLGDYAHIARQENGQWTGRELKSVLAGVQDGYSIVDVLPPKNARDILSNVQYVVAFGPMGIYESEFKSGTNAFIDAVVMVNPNARFIIGGGDSAAAYKNALNKDVSTGGGASISYIIKGTLPALEALK